MICNGDYCIPLNTTNTNDYEVTDTSKWKPPSKDTLWSIYGATWCSYCRKAKQLLLDTFDEKDVYYYDIGCSNFDEFTQKMSSFTNDYKYIPMIFYGDVFIGGYTNLVDFLSKQ